MRVAIGASAAVLALVLSGCVPAEEPADEPTERSAPTTSAPESPASESVAPEGTEDEPSAAPAPQTALAALSSLPVKGRAPMTGYQRARFGQAWLDADRNGCDTRNDTLARDLVDVVFASGTNDCRVSHGRLTDPYTAQTIVYLYGDGTQVDIDHVVALGNAWVTGGFAWDIERRAAIANDPLNLLGVDASANRQKGDGDAATWLPPNNSFRCDYVARQVAVKAKYGLWVTPAERDAVERVLGRCPGQLVPPDSGAPVEVDQNLTDPGAPARPAPTSAGGPHNSATTPFENCDAARAAGAAPVLLGDAGYGSHLDGDGDGDGRACE